MVSSGTDRRRPTGPRLRILVVEDEFLIAQDIRRVLRAEGYEVVGPIAGLDAALSVAARDDLDGAVLDLNLRGELVFPLAEQLQARGVPILFTTGYERDVLPASFAACFVLQKPFRSRRLREMAHAAFTREEVEQDAD